MSTVRCLMGVFLGVMVPLSIFAGQDTLRLSMEEAEQRFIERNLQVLSARANVEAAKAAIEQAGLWSNPNLSIEQNVYNPATKRYFDFTQDGNTEVALQQLLTLAGKRGKQIRIAEINASMSELALADLVRTLRLELRTNVIDLAYLRKSLSFYDESLATLRQTVISVERVYQNRSVLLSEVLRLKALLLSLETERQGRIRQAEDIQSDLRILLRDTSQAIIAPILDTESFERIDPDSSAMSAAIQSALRTRPDLMSVEASVHLDQANLSLQKAMSVPDVTIGGRWSRQGSYIPDYYAVSFAIDLPLFNRNQGIIALAERTLEADTYSHEGAKMRVVREIRSAYQRALEADRLYRSLDPSFGDSYRTLIKGMVSNYEKRNISLLEFTDFFESYRTSMTQVLQAANDRLDAFEAFNHAAGSKVLQP